MTPFAELADRFLEPLRGRGDEDWRRSRDGEWSPGQIVEHLAIAIEMSARGFESRADKPPMQRRPRSAWQVAAFQVVRLSGWFGPRRRAPEMTVPGMAPDRAATEARLRTAVAAYQAVEQRLLPRRANDLFVKHPVFGDLTLEEFKVFHVRHAEHHRQQMVDRLG